MWINKIKLTGGKIRSYFTSLQKLLEIELVNEKYKKCSTYFQFILNYMIEVNKQRNKLSIFRSKINASDS
jgi:uncharacterized membrane protein